MKSFSCLLLMAFLTANLAAQTPGTPDSSYNLTGKFSYDLGFQDNLQDVIVQSDGKIVSGGTAINPAFSGQLLVIRQLADGTLDNTFNDSGIVIFNQYTESYAYDLAERDDHKLLIAGAKADPSFSFAALVIRLLPDGTPDSSFGVNGFAEINLSTGDDFAYAMKEQPDHKILLAGTFTNPLFQNQPVVIRLLENGTPDSTFGVNGVAYIPVIETDNRLNSLSLMSDGRIVVSGHYGKPLTGTGQFDFDMLIARLNNDGTFDASFGNNGMVIDTVSTDYVDDLFGMDITAGNEIIVSGYTTNQDFSFDLIALKYDSTGTRDSSFANNGLYRFDNDVQDVGLDLQLQADGKILIAGTSGGFFFDDRDFLLMRLNTDGSPDVSVGGTGYTLTTILNDFDEANGMTIQSDGRIILAGKTFNGTNNDVAIARFFADYTVGVPDAANNSSVRIFPNPVKQGAVLFLQGVKGVVQLYDLQGKCVFDGIANDSFRVPTSLHPGFYFLYANQSVIKLVVE